MKQYNLGGLGSNVELGKQGPSIVGSDSSQITLNDADGNVVVATVAEGTDPSHAVQKSQLDAQLGQKISSTTVTVNYNDGTVFIGTASANAYIHKVVVESATTWTDADSSTNITVGDSGDADRLFTGFDPDVQSADETDHKYTSETSINAYVTQGGASAGTAKVTVWYSGTIDTSSEAITVEYLIVGGGGGGGTSYDNAGAPGGGAGMALTSNTTIYTGVTYNIVVGAGGAGGPDTRTNTGGSAGSSSSALGITALGGGAGSGSRTGAPGGAANSGGAAQVSSTTAPTGGYGTGGGGDGGGGGGATGAGDVGGTDTYPNNGGAGLTSAISGSSVTYSTGGAGGYNGGPWDGASGTANSGNGGAGGSSPSFNSAAGGSGGSGVVIIRYADSTGNATTSGSVTFSQTGGYKIYKFTGNGTITL